MLRGRGGGGSTRGAEGKTGLRVQGRKITDWFELITGSQHFVDMAAL